MARQPVQLPSRGGANAAGVGNRAQYLRPAKDTQNSRALASAFSQMNRAFGRIASNEQRIANQQMADELQQAEEEQKILESRALIAGQMSALTGEDQAALYANNPAAQQSYFEGAVQSEMSQGMIGIANDFRGQSFYGDPMRQDEARQWLQSAYSEAFEGVDPIMVGGMLNQINSQSASLLKENDNAVFQTAQVETTRQMTNSMQSAMINGDAGSFLAEVEILKENSYLDLGVAGNDITVSALGFALSQAAAGDREDYLSASANYASLMGNAEFMGGLNPQQREKIQKSFDAAELQFRRREAADAAAAEAAMNLEVAKLDQQLINAYLAGDQTGINSLINSYARLDYTTDKWSNRAETIQDNIDITQQAFLEGGRAVDVVSAKNLHAAQHYMDVNNITKADPEFITYVLGQQSQLTEKDFKTLMTYDANTGVEAFNHQAYKNVSRHLNALGDLFADNLPAGSEQLAKLVKDFEVAGFEKQSIFRRSMQSAIDGFLRDSQENYPQTYDAQRTMINDAVNFALNQFLEGTEVNGVNILDKMRDANGLLPDNIVNSPVFKAYFTDTGYEQKYQEYLTLKAENDTAAIESLPVGVRVSEDQDDPPFTFDDEDGDGISDSRESLLDEQEASDITRESLGITRIDRQQQDDGGKVPASIRTFNFGAIGNVSNAAAQENFEKAFEGKTLGAQDLPGLDGSDVPTTAFKTVEDGIRYFGWWMAYRGSPGTIDDLAVKYYPTGTGLSQEEREKVLRDRADWVSGVSSYSGLDQDEEITSDNMSALAHGVFSHEAGPNAWTYTKIGTTVDMAALIEEGKQLYEDNK